MHSYQRIADTLRTRIQDGTYRVGERIPSMNELEQSFQVSNMTVRKARDQLLREGLVIANSGAGTRVVRSPATDVVDIRMSGNFAEWFESASAKSYPIKQKVLGIDFVRAPTSVAALLASGAEEQVWRLRRSRSIRGEPVSHHVNYARASFAGLITEKDLAGRKSFVELLRVRYPEQLAVMDQRVEAMVANIDMAELLGVEFGAPVFFVENVYRTQAGEVAAVTHLYLRADRYCYSAKIAIENGGSQARTTGVEQDNER